MILNNKIAIFPFVFAFFLVLTSCKEEEKEQNPMQLSVLEVKTEPHANTHLFTGFTIADSTVEIIARVNGYIMERRFNEGDKVKRGQTLYQIEPYQYEANLKNAQGLVIAAKATVERTKRDYERAENLLKNGNISQSGYDAARAAYENAVAQLMQAEASLKIAELNLTYTKVEAPISGKISLSRYDVGNLVGPDAGILTTIVKSDPIKVHIGISEGFLLTFGKYFTSDKKLAKIQAKMQLRNGSEYEETGKISFFDVMVDSSSNTITARVEFPNPDMKILPGQFVTITIVEPVQENRILLPQELVLTSQGKHIVMVVEDGKVAGKSVVLGQSSGRNIVIESGLREGDLVIAEALQKIRIGMPISYKKISKQDLIRNQQSQEENTSPQEQVKEKEDIQLSEDEGE